MKHRARPDRGHVSPSSLPQGPNGYALCRFCQTECRPPRKTFCSDLCIHLWKVQTQPGYAAAQVLARDNGVCSRCGVDCVVLLQELKRLRAAERSELYGDWWARTSGSGGANATLPGDLEMPRFAARLAELGIVKSRRYLGQRLWEMDHMLPVSEGGGACGLENLRTLCWSCHAKETAALAARRALSKA